MRESSCSYHFRFALKTIEQVVDSVDVHAISTGGCGFQSEHSYAGLDLDPHLVEVNSLNRLLTRFENAWQRGVTRFVEPEVGCDHCRKLDGENFVSCVGFPCDAYTLIDKF